VAEFLTDAWLDELAAVAGAVTVPDDLHLVVQQVVLDDRGRETAYAIRIAGGRASVTPGRVHDADVTFTQDRDTAVAIAQGELSAQVAFMAGRLRVGGDLHEVMDRTQQLVELGDLFAPARADTIW
jgi:putative sterol carrier protein